MTFDETGEPTPHCERIRIPDRRDQTHSTAWESQALENGQQGDYRTNHRLEGVLSEPRETTEGFKEPFQIFLDNANARIRYCNLQLDLLIAAFTQLNGDGNFSGLGKFNGISNQVGQHLPQSQRITPEPLRQSWRQCDCEFQIFGLRFQQTTESHH